MKATSTFSILFWVNFSRIKNEQASIYARITVNGKRVAISLKRKVDISDWDTDKNRARGTKQETRLLNKYLDQIHSRIFECYQELLAEKKLITAQAIKARFLGEDEKQYSLLSLIDYHNTQMSESLRWGTLKNYFTTQKYIKMFLKKKFKTDDIYLSQLTYKFLIDFEIFLRVHRPTDHQKPMGNNTVMKHIERLRKITSLAVDIEWMEKDVFSKFKPKFKKNERQFLTQNELQSIEEKQFSIERLELVKDLFIFSCYTGLSYIDEMNLTKDHINFGIDGNLWIVTQRRKTENTVRIPILPVVGILIQKYAEHPRALQRGTLLPNMSNQKLNTYLKEIADLCHIKKNLTFHLARHTFATTVTLSNGVPIETVSKLLGHSRISTTQIYAKVVEKKVSEDMQVLKEKFNKKNTDNTNSNAI